MPIVGNCKRCGRCCEEGARFEYSFIEEENGEQKLVFSRYNGDPSPELTKCHALSYDPDSGQAICGKQDKKSLPSFDKEDFHLVICRLYPQAKEELVFPECGFRWVD